MNKQVWKAIASGFAIVFAAGCAVAEEIARQQQEKKYEELEAKVEALEAKKSE